MRLEALREESSGLHVELPRNDLVVWTGGNVSVRDPETGLVVDQAVRRSLRGPDRRVDGRGRPRRTSRGGRAQAIVGYR